MKRIVLLPILLSAALSWGASCPYGTPAHLDPASLTTFEGKVTAVSVAWGKGQPSMTLGTASGDVTILLGPIWYMDQSRFTIEVGSALIVKAFRAVQKDSADYVAQEITNRDKNTTLAFRDADGYPLWKGKGGHGRGQGNGQGNGGNGNRP